MRTQLNFFEKYRYNISNNNDVCDSEKGKKYLNIEKIGSQTMMWVKITSGEMTVVLILAIVLITWMWKRRHI